MAPSTLDVSYRIVWLDVCRGVAVAGMILVNNPGSWADVYWPLAHAGWHGWTPADLIFDGKMVQTLALVLHELATNAVK